MPQKYILSLIFIISFFKLSAAEAPHLLNYLVVLNTGQGQWLTFVKNETCQHYDFGGEKMTEAKVRKIFIRQCFRKHNQLFLSHWDLDHYAFLKLIQQNSTSVCWGFKPIGESLATNIPFCLPDNLNYPRLVYYNPLGKTKNSTSAVFEKNNILIPGDSDTRSEKTWSHLLSRLKIQILILGHHGSRTSNSENLLKHLPDVKLALASSRFKKYRHPHPLVVERLNKYKIPILKTEDWGHLYFDL